jgi:hypothetical protein
LLISLVIVDLRPNPFAAWHGGRRNGVCEHAIELVAQNATGCRCQEPKPFISDFSLGKTHRSSVHKSVSFRDGVCMFGTRFMGVDEEVIGVDFNSQGETQHKRTQKYNKEIGRESATHFHT